MTLTMDNYIIDATHLYPDKCPYYSPNNIDGVKPRRKDCGRGCRVDDWKLFIGALTQVSSPDFPSTLHGKRRERVCSSHNFNFATILKFTSASTTYDQLFSIIAKRQVYTTRLSGVNTLH